MIAAQHAYNLALTRTLQIRAPIERVWDALINPAMTKEHLFGCVAETDWAPGSDIQWKGHEDGVIYVVGQVIRFEPPYLLESTTFSPHSGYKDIPENYLTGTYELSQNEGFTTLNITQGDFAVVAEGEKRYGESIEAWNLSLGILKKILES